jgi:hypothetical protein
LKRLLAAAMVLAMLALVGCGASTGGAQPGSSTASSTTAIASNPVITDTGWGAVSIGAGVSEVEAVLGAAETEEDIGGTIFRNYLSKGVQINYGEAPLKAVAIFFFNHATDKPDFAPFEGGVDRGISWTSTPEEVLAAYGSPLHDYHGDDGESWRRLAYPNISFRFESGRLAEIGVGPE